MSKQDTLSGYFEEAQAAIASQTKLWDKNFYGPILIVDPKTRMVTANYPDSAGFLQANGKGYTGILPGGINIANYVIQWGGRSWAMIMSNLIPARKEDRINLFAHELFHRVQDSLGFTLETPDNRHLEQKEARIYLRLELEALKQALFAADQTSMLKHIRHALGFRQYRYQLFPGAANQENRLELNEGITEYTGLIIDGRKRADVVLKATRRIEGMQLSEQSFVRNFAYATTPVYGYLLRTLQPYWNKKLQSTTDLTRFFVSGFGIRIPDLSTGFIKDIAKEYYADSIVANENRREEKIKSQVRQYREKLLQLPHTEIPCTALKFTANTGAQLSLDSMGTVYLSFFNGSDQWGSLTVEKGGVLVYPGKQKIHIGLPMSTEGELMKGENWVLKLKEGYRLQKDNSTGNFVVIKP